MAFWFDNVANDVLFAIKEASGMVNLTDKEEVLSKIESLDLSDSSIPASQIPYFVREMVNLKSLNMSDGQLSGTITSEMFPAGLENLNLSNNNISAFHFGEGLENLRSLNLSYNKVKSLPEGLEKAKGLRDLKLSENSLEQISLKLPEGLSSLDLASNELSLLKAEVGGAIALKELNLSNNKLTNLPDSLFSGVLVYLNISDNPLEIGDIHQKDTRVYIQV